VAAPVEAARVEAARAAVAAVAVAAAAVPGDSASVRPAGTVSPISKAPPALKRNALNAAAS
jgi:hypothetical protein